MGPLKVIDFIRLAAFLNFIRVLLMLALGERELQTVSADFVKDILEAGLNEVSSSRFFISERSLGDKQELLLDNAVGASSYCGEEIYRLAQNLVRRCIIRGIVQIADFEKPLLDKKNLTYFKFVESVVNDLILQGLTTSIENLTCLPVTPVEAMTFVTS